MDGCFFSSLYGLWLAFLGQFVQFFLADFKRRVAEKSKHVLHTLNRTDVDVVLALSEAVLRVINKQHSVIAGSVK
jgi:hypothetical protein